MEKQAALHIVQALAQGIDPHTGETFPASGPYQHPDTVRALFEAAHALAALTALTDLPAAPSGAASGTGDDTAIGAPRNAARGAHENAGKPWSDAEDQALAAGFDAGKTLGELAGQHRRSRVAIQARLVRLGRMEPPASGPRFRIALPAHAGE